MRELDKPWTTLLRMEHQKMRSLIFKLKKTWRKLLLIN